LPAAPYPLAGIPDDVIEDVRDTAEDVRDDVRRRRR